MSEETRVVRPHYRRRTVILEDGSVVQPPEGWELLKPGDAALTRKVKQAGPSWTVQQKKGRRTFSHGVWAPAEQIAEAREEVEAMRADPSYQKRRASAKRRKTEKEAEYAEDFTQEIVRFLDFAPTHEALAQQLAEAVSAHATPVGSGTVARTQRISIEERAEAALIAWMRHNTSAYDRIKVPRKKGARRELRRRIAKRSRELLQQYREDQDFELDTCPLYMALQP